MTVVYAVGVGVPRLIQGALLTSRRTCNNVV